VPSIGSAIPTNLEEFGSGGGTRTLDTRVMIPTETDDRPVYVDNAVQNEGFEQERFDEDVPDDM